MVELVVGVTFNMIYICDSCKFLFRRTDEPTTCPDCGSENIREANEEENLEFEENKKMHGR
ncbi:MAG: hypothetical protein FWE04_01510 [Oscillospiraceae bacterium]|nr:hypothetical protein [Oscillospiraceae bacterium]